MTREPERDASDGSSAPLVRPPRRPQEGRAGGLSPFARSVARAAAGSLVALAGVLLLVLVLLALGDGGNGDGDDTAVDDPADLPAVSVSETSNPATPGATSPSPRVSPSVTTSARATPPPSRSPTASRSPTSSSSPEPTEPSASPSAEPDEQPTRLPLTVLNNTLEKGLATRAAEQFAEQGWEIVGIADWREPTPATTVYYSPGQESAARRLAAEFPAVERVVERSSNGDRNSLTVVVTSDFPA